MSSRLKMYGVDWSEGAIRGTIDMDVVGTCLTLG